MTFVHKILIILSVLTENFSSVLNRGLKGIGLTAELTRATSIKVGKYLDRRS